MDNTYDILKNGENNNKSGNNFYYGTVVEISDKGDKKIKVRINGIDDLVKDSDLPWVTPFLPLMISIPPKKDEMVKVIPQNPNDMYNNREWIGPVIINDLNMDYQDNKVALANQPNSSYKESSDINLIEDGKEIYPQDVPIVKGRDNNYILLDDKMVDIKVGFHDVKDKKKRNPNVGSIKVYVNDSNETVNVINANKILLISKGKYKNYIDEDEVKKIISEAMSMTYAEPTIEFMELMKDFVANHIHASNLPPNKGQGSIREILNFDLEKIKAKNIKIN